MSPTDYRKAAQIAEQEFPQIWKQCYPRRYMEPGHSQYDSPKSIARAMMDAIFAYASSIANHKQPGQTEQNEALWASMMVKYGVPTYYLSRDMAIALTQTAPSEVMNCFDIELPMEAAAFMLPTNAIIHKDLGPVAFVSYVRAFANNSVMLPGPVPGFKHELHSVHGTFSIFIRTVEGTMLHWTFSEGVHMVDLKNEEELEELQTKYMHSSSSPFDQSFTPADTVAMTRAIKFAFNVILLMTHKPELVEPAALIKRVGKGREEPVEYWSPHVIGRSYKLRYEHHESSGGTHASPRGHWVSGFWREQPHGPNHSLRKTLWIEPFWRGGRME